MAEGMPRARRLNNTWFRFRARMHPGSAANDAEAYLRARAENTDAPVSPVARARDRAAKALTRHLLAHQNEYPAEQQALNRANKPESPGRVAQSMNRLKGRVGTQLSLVALRHQLRYETEQPMVGVLAGRRRGDRAVDLLAPVHAVKSRRVSGKALQGDARDVMDRFEASAFVAPESPRQVRRAERSVRRAFGSTATLPLTSGYQPQTLTAHPKAPAEIQELVGGMLKVAPLQTLNPWLDGVRRLLFVRQGKTARIDYFSDISTRGHHVETVKNLLTAKGTQNIDNIQAYMYIRTQRADTTSTGEGGQRAGRVSDIAPGDDYIVALEPTTELVRL